MADRVYTGPIAQEIADAILNQRESPSLKRYPDGRVKVIISDVIPADGFNQTIFGRRKRFRAKLESLLAVGGWTSVGINTYKQRGAP